MTRQVTAPPPVHMPLLPIAMLPSTIVIHTDTSFPTWIQMLAPMDIHSLLGLFSNRLRTMVVPVVVAAIPHPLQVVVDAILAQLLMDLVARIQVATIVAVVMGVVADEAMDVEMAMTVAVGMEVVMGMDLPAP